MCIGTKCFIVCSVSCAVAVPRLFRGPAPVVEEVRNPGALVTTVRGSVWSCLEFGICLRNNSEIQIQLLRDESDKALVVRGPCKD